MQRTVKWLRVAGLVGLLLFVYFALHSLFYFASFGVLTMHDQLHDSSALEVALFTYEVSSIVLASFCGSLLFYHRQQTRFHHILLIWIMPLLYAGNWPFERLIENIWLNGLENMSFFLRRELSFYTSSVGRYLLLGLVLSAPAAYAGARLNGWAIRRIQAGACDQPKCMP